MIVVSSPRPQLFVALALGVWDPVLLHLFPGHLLACNQTHDCQIPRSFKLVRSFPAFNEARIYVDKTPLYFRVVTSKKPILRRKELVERSSRLP